MSNPRPLELPADWLDHLVLDMTELEALAARLERSIGAIRPTEVSEDPLSVQILDVLTRVSDTTGALHQLAKGRLMSVATAMAAASATDEPAASLDRPSDRSNILRVDPTSRRRVLMSVR